MHVTPWKHTVRLRQQTGFQSHRDFYTMNGHDEESPSERLRLEPWKALRGGSRKRRYGASRGHLRRSEECRAAKNKKTRSWGRPGLQIIQNLDEWIRQIALWLAWLRFPPGDLSVLEQFRIQRHRPPGGSCIPPTGWHCSGRTHQGRHPGR